MQVIFVIKIAWNLVFETVRWEQSWWWPIVSE